MRAKPKLERVESCCWTIKVNCIKPKKGPDSLLLVTTSCKKILIGCVAITALFDIVLTTSCKRRNSSRAKNADVAPTPAASLAKVSASRYAMDCAANSIPLPLSIQNREFWKNEKPIHSDLQHFAAGGSPGSLHTHQAEDGSGCLELVTKGFDTSFEGFGLPRSSAFSICWSASGHVCFWENNAKEPISQPIYSLDQSTPYSQLDNNCISCHRGDNPFVGHSDSGDPTFTNFPPVNFLKPIVPAQWLPAEGWDAAQKGDEAYQCAGGCHSIPRLHGNHDKYCGLAIAMNQAGLMLGGELGIVDPQRPRPAPHTTKAYGKDLLDKCQRYRNFLETCGTLVKKEDIGVCPMPSE
jgi:hypothetical protein